MLKVLFSLLLLTNVLLFAYREAYLPSVFPEDHEPARIGRQMHPERIILLPNAGQNRKPLPATGDTPTGSAPVPVPGSIPEPLAGVAASVSPTSAGASPVTSSAPSVNVPGLVPGSAPGSAPINQKLTCTEVGNFDATEAARFAQRLAPLGLGEAVSRRSVVEPPRMMVYMPPQGSKEGAEKKAGELRRLGINDFFIMPDGDYQWGISLGVFRSEEAARAHLTQMGKRGVVTARLGPFSPGASRIAFQFRGLDAKASVALKKIKADFAKQETQACE